MYVNENMSREAVNVTPGGQRGSVFSGDKVHSQIWKDFRLPLMSEYSLEKIKDVVGQVCEGVVLATDSKVVIAQIDTVRGDNSLTLTLGEPFFAITREEEIQAVLNAIFFKASTYHKTVLSIKGVSPDNVEMTSGMNRIKDVWNASTDQDKRLQAVLDNATSISATS